MQTLRNSKTNTESEGTEKKDPGKDTEEEQSERYPGDIQRHSHQE